MALNIFKVTNTSRDYRRSGCAIYLHLNNWDDYGFRTLFYLTVQDYGGIEHKIGEVKIGYNNQEGDTSTDLAIKDGLSELGANFFSVGQDVNYYENLMSLPKSLREDILLSLSDIVFSPRAEKIALNNKVFDTSLLRSVSFSTITEQFRRILKGENTLKPFNFRYRKDPGYENAGVELDFFVTPYSKPASNIHVLIGRNGTGKTRILNDMIVRLVGPQTQKDAGNFFELTDSAENLENKYFSSIISTSFSAFDPFDPPDEQIGEDSPTRYSYIGLKNVDKEVEIHHPALPVAPAALAQEFVEGRGRGLKRMQELSNDFCKSLDIVLSLSKKRENWLNAIQILSSDNNFAEMQLEKLADISEKRHNTLFSHARNMFVNMSSGHAVVLLTITKLVERSEERTLLIMDEPESHLHPPLLSAFVRVISSLLNSKNGVAIVATHSPVILQEVPRTCVWKLRRTGMIMRAERPEAETFGENVGILTREVFGLEVANSGFHEVLKEAVDQGKNYDEVLREFKGQIGFEGRAMLRALIDNRDY